MKENEVFEIRKIKKMLEKDKGIIFDEYWREMTPEGISKTLQLLNSSAVNYEKLDRDCQAITVCGIRNALYYLRQTRYWDMVLDIAIIMIDQKEIVIANDLLLARMSLADRIRIVRAIENVGGELDALGHVFHFLWDSYIDERNCGIWLRLCGLFKNSVYLFEEEIRDAFLIYEKEEGTSAILEDDELRDLLHRLPSFIITLDNEEKF